MKREDILRAKDYVIVPLEVPKWGGTIYIRSFNGKSRDTWESYCLNAKQKDGTVNLTNCRAVLAVLSVCGEDGKLMFTMNDVEALGEKDADILSEIFAIAERLNKLSERDVQELTKNSETVPSGDSTSA